MSSVVYSSDLHHVIRNLKQFNSQEITNMFKDSRWFETKSISIEEARIVENLFAKSDGKSRQESSGADSWY